MYSQIISKSFQIEIADQSKDKTLLWSQNIKLSFEEIKKKKKDFLNVDHLIPYYWTACETLLVLI